VLVRAVGGGTAQPVLLQICGPRYQDHELASLVMVKVGRETGSGAINGFFLDRRQPMFDFKLIKPP
jgi:hypothetical protein